MEHFTGTQAVSSRRILDILENMASLYISKSVDEVTIDDWDAQMAVDLRASWLCARAAIPHMRRLRGGRIINFTDWVARSVHLFGSDYHFGFGARQQ